MAFIEDPRFPDDISQGSRGGPAWSTEVVSSRSGWEQRNIRWANAKHTYDVSYGVRDVQNLEHLAHFFATTRGRAHEFRFKDWADYKSTSVLSLVTATDQVIGTGDGTTTQYQLQKKYDVAGIPWNREIKKPVVNTVLIAVDGVTVTPANIDHTTGLITLSTPPGAGLSVTAGFEFDVPCRFGTDILQTQMEVYYLGSAQTPVEEVRI